MTTRRSFLRTASVAAASCVIPWRLARAGSLASLHPSIDPALGTSDPMLKELALRGIDAARSAGATYADVRFTSDRTQTVSPSDTFGTVRERGTVYVAVRAIVAGGWGIASAPECTADVIVRLAREATAQASVNRWSTGSPVLLDEYPSKATGNWSTPLVRDPFQVSIEEKADFLHDCVGAPELLGFRDVTVQTELKFRRQEKVFASTTGAYVTQTLSWVGPCDLQVTWANPTTAERLSVTAPVVPLQSGGYELVSSLRPHNRLEDLVDEIYRQQQTMPIQLGKYTVVFDAYTTAALVRSMIGHATELDRVRGDEVNAVGTSYLTESFLGKPVANQMVTVTGSRSLKNGPSLTGWDDEGVVPESFPIVSDGVLVDFATSRSGAPHLSSWYKSRNQPVRSHGCTVANSAADLPSVYPPDLTLQPSSHSAVGNSSSGASFEGMVSDAKQGVAVLNGNCFMDHQQRSGQIYGTMYDVRNGQMGRCLGTGAVLVVRSTELLRNVVALGDASSAVLRGFSSKKGQPEQEASHGVLAVPMTVRDVVLLDARRS